jgi:hypothetical protein
VWAGRDADFAVVYEAVVSLALGLDQKGRALCYEHADQTFGSLIIAPGWPGSVQ